MGADPSFLHAVLVYQYCHRHVRSHCLRQTYSLRRAGALDDYKRFLRGGCSMDCIDLLKSCGVDMTTTEPTTSALKVFDSYLGELEKMF